MARDFDPSLLHWGISGSLIFLDLRRWSLPARIVVFTFNQAYGGSIARWTN